MNTTKTRSLIEFIRNNMPMVDNTTAKILSNHWKNDFKTFADFANKARDVGDEELGCFYYYNQAVTELNAIVNVEIASSICDWCRGKEARKFVDSIISEKM